MARIGYARVSSLDQDHAMQAARLKAAGCEIIRKEKASGKTRAGRDELAAILEFIRAGDELVVVKLDRLGRSTRDVLNLVHELEQEGAGLRVLEPEFCTSTDTGRILVTVLGMVAEMERRFILERQRVGIEAAKRKGVYRGRKPSVPVDEVRKMREDGKGPAEIAAALSISRMSVWCGFRGLRPGIPIERGHAFRSKAATCSEEGGRGVVAGMRSWVSFSWLRQDWRAGQ